jgi:hypothetical protein
MNILYIAYWGIGDGLTASTVFPHLAILADYKQINQIIFCTIERGGHPVEYSGPILNKIKFTPLYSKNIRPSVMNKVLDFVLFPQQLINICHTFNVAKIISRGAPAGALAYKVHTKTSIPYYVESYEPHADYMLESGVWTRWNPKYIFEKRWEEKIKKTAKLIVTVSTNYRIQLLNEGVDENRLAVVPCCVKQQDFRLNEDNRVTTRTKLNIAPNDIAGIYLGKFGGIYYDDEAYAIFKATFESFKKKFFLLILTPDNKTEIITKLKQHDIPLERVYVEKVPHSEVPVFLSAADFAFAFYRPNHSAKYLSPVKFGEYWANGLPILTPAGIGDDSDIIINEKKGGVVFSLSNIKNDLIKLSVILESKSRQHNYQEIKGLAEKYRSFSILLRVYNQIIQNS